MKIPLDDRIWSRLYGPYGAHDVSSHLRVLSQNWNEAVAQDLFWEQLYHQGDIYPVTYAALPWLWSLEKLSKKARKDLLTFLSFVVHSATCSEDVGATGDGPESLYRGLSLNIDHHRLDWIDKECRLRVEDLDILSRLEAWFAENAPDIASDCVASIDSNDDDLAAVFLVQGLVTLNGGEGLTEALNWWSDGDSARTIIERVPFEAEDVAAARLLLPLVRNRSPILSDFLEKFLRHHLN